jgi:hypothetical protein
MFCSLRLRSHMFPEIGMWLKYSTIVSDVRKLRDVDICCIRSWNVRVESSRVESVLCSGRVGGKTIYTQNDFPQRAVSLPRKRGDC